MTLSLSQNEEQATLATALLAQPHFVTRSGIAIRRAINSVVDGPNTGRISVFDLTTTEKTSIGTVVEGELRAEFGWPAGSAMDFSLSGIDFDCKSSIAESWMIPPEAVRLAALCLLVSANELTSKYYMGLIRADINLLGAPNRDGKRGITALGKSQIHWLVNPGSLPPNILFQLQQSDPAMFDAIVSQCSGQARVTQLFRLAQGAVVDRHTIEVLGEQVDPGKRVRDARNVLQHEGIRILGGRYDQSELSSRGFGYVPNDSYVSVAI